MTRQRLDPSRILSRSEVLEVVSNLHSQPGVNARQNLIIFRLACGCGLRCKEIAGLETSDFRIGSERPVIKVRREISKNYDSTRGRTVPLWWDPDTRKDLLDWISGRKGWVVTKHRRGVAGNRTSRRVVADRWKTAIKCLGPERVRQLSVHCGRHTFCTHALIAGRTLAEVRDAAGHWDVSITDLYLHVADSFESTATDLYPKEKRNGD